MTSSNDVRAAGGGGERGFSLVEVMIAMICTTIIGGAMVAMIVGGNNAFKREPALSDRQQNIRVAMDLIQKDVFSAGGEMEPWVQAFAVGDGVGFTTPPLLNGRGPNMGPDGMLSDGLVIIGNPGDCPAIPVEPAVAGVNIRPLRPAPACYDLPALIFLQGVQPSPMPSPAVPTYAMGFACDPTAVGEINFPPGQGSDYNFPGGNGIPEPMERMMPLQVIRYLIAPENPADPSSPPGLWRSPQGGVNPEGSCGIGSGDPDAGSGFQLIARGIEDLQVHYTMAGAPTTKLDSPAIVAIGDYNTLVKEVEVVLTARALAVNLHGETEPDTAAAAVGVPRAVRSRMQSVTTPRAALLHLAKVTPTPIWR
jgi:Prokaryotic N-terminal methylation motif